MNKVLLGDVAEEVRENYKETDDNPAVVGLEHLIPGEIRFGMIQQERQNNIINILGGHSYAM